jgi:hypothetical protein
MKMTRFELIGVPAHFEDANAVPVKLTKKGFCSKRHGDHLSCYCMAIFLPRCPNFPNRNLQSMSYLALEILRAHVALFYPQIKKITGSGRLIGWDFFNLEIFWSCLDLAAYSRQFRGQ